MKVRTYALTALSCLLIGIFVTVLLSWAIPIRNYYGKLYFSSKADALPLEWPFDVATHWPPVPNDAAMTSRWGFDLQYYEWTSYGAGSYDPSSPKRNEYTIWIRRCGWPFRAMACIDKHESSITAGGGQHSLSGADSSPWTWTVPGFKNNRLEVLDLPLKPLFPGFLLDALIFASAPFAGIVAVKKRKLARLAKEWRCVKCRYQVDGLVVCPECGTPTQLP